MSIFIFIAVFFAYHSFFTLVSLDPERKALIHNSTGSPEFQTDPTFALFPSYYALFMTLLFFALYAHKNECSTEPNNAVSIIVTVGVVFFVGSIFFGPIKEVRKSIALTASGTYERPWRMIVSDFFLGIPMNFMIKMGWKLVSVAVAVVLGFLGIRAGLYASVPDAMALLWTFWCFGRVSGFLIHSPVPKGYYLPIYGVTILVAALISSHVDQFILACSGQSPGLPTLFQILLAITAFILSLG